MQDNKKIYHKSVLVNEVIEYLDPQPHGVYVDATFGGGGHTRAILEHEPQARVVAIDWDAVALEKHEQEFEELFPDRIQFLWGNFAHVIKLLKKQGIDSVDGILADFGTSQYQITQRPGFSVYQDSYLDMRMSPAHQRMTAAHIINNATERELCDIFWTFGQERNAKEIVRLIVQEREKKKITRTKELAQLVERVVPYKRGKIHPATRVFQALRIYINSELENIKAFLAGALQMVKPGGRIVCISFHSLEDRLVKQFFKEHPCDGTDHKGVKILTPKVVMASEQELEVNPSARSACLRVAQVCKKNQAV